MPDELEADVLRSNVPLGRRPGESEEFLGIVGLEEVVACLFDFRQSGYLEPVAEVLLDNLDALAVLHELIKGDELTSDGSGGVAAPFEVAMIPVEQPAVELARGIDAALGGPVGDTPEPVRVAPDRPVAVPILAAGNEALGGLRGGEVQVDHSEFARSIAACRERSNSSQGATTFSRNSLKLSSPASDDFA